MLLPTIIAAVLAATPQEVQAAKADYALELADGWDARYIECPDEDSLKVVQFVTVLASREPLLNYTVAERLPGTSLARIRINALRWKTEDWCRFLGYPANRYTRFHNPLIVRGDYLVSQLTDGTKSGAYLAFYFDKPPKTLDEFLAAVGVDPKKQGGFELRHVEASSRVNLARDAARLILSMDGTFTRVWVTYDVTQPVKGKDPLESLFEDKFQADGIEAFALVPKAHTSGVRGVFPAMVLANGAGKIVQEAPVALVSDSTKFGGQSAIRSIGSCITCHIAGSQPVTKNALRDRLQAGVELKAYDKQLRTTIELTHLGDVSSDLKEWDTDYAAALLAVNGCTPEENAELFAAYSAAYLADVTLEKAATELGCDEKDLPLALGYASAAKVKLSVRLAGLAHGKSMPRASWERDYLTAYELLAAWRAAR